MFVDTPKALDSRHSVDSFNVGLVLIDGGIVNRFVNPKGPGCLKRHPLLLFKIETIDCLTGHFAW